MSSKAYYERYWSVAEAPRRCDALTRQHVRLFTRWVSDTERVLDLGCGNGEGARELEAS